MTSIFERDGATIGQVRIRTRLDDPLAAGQKIASMLGGADMRQSRLLPSSILCVRRMRDPLPGTRWLDGRRVHPGPEWEQAATRELDRLAEEAAYPSRAAVPSSAPAVAFVDRAELLACFAMDWLSGTAQANWWWLLLLQSSDPATAVMREWESAPAFVPAALELLQTESRAIEFVRRLSDPVAERLLGRMLEAHGIVSTSVDGVAPSVVERNPRVPAPGELLPVSAEERTEAGAPWLALVPEASAAGLGLPARRLLAYGLLLRRAPQVARAAWFRRGVEAWLSRAVIPVLPEADDSPQDAVRSPNEVPPPSMAEIRARSAGQPLPLHGDSRTSISETRAEPALHTPQAFSEAPALPREQIGSDSCPTESPHETRSAAPAVSAAPLAADGSSDLGQSETARARESSARQSSPMRDLAGPPPMAGETVTRAEAAGAAREATLPAPIETAYGGSCFLLNVALYLGLYGDFAHPLHRGLELSVWDFVALFGREFVGDGFCEDSLWEQLASLAGRSAFEPPGAHFDAPDFWRIPAEWLEPFGEPEPFRASTVRERLVITHPADFCMVDVPLAGRVPAQALEDEMQPYQAGVSLEARGTWEERAPLARWIFWMAGYVRARLGRAMGCENGPLMLCRVPARLRVTPAHVHVFMRLEGYPIEIRLAGLDRDPGWIPAAGRNVSFHFD